MQKALVANFTRGEVTPLAHSRSDAEFYKAAAKYVRNWVVRRYGGVTRRSGTRYCGATKSQTSVAAFIPFVFSSTQAYVLEFGDLYVRFWTPEGLQITSGGVPYEIVSPYAAADVARIQWAQSNDVMYLAHPSYFPQKLTRASHTSWSFANVNFQDGPYLPINDTTTTLTVSAAPSTGGSITITFSSTTNVNKGAGLQSTDVGRHVRLQLGGSYSWGKITAVSSTTVATLSVASGNGGTGATLTWRLGMISKTLGYPGSVAFFEGRLCWGRMDSYPNMIGLSRSALPETYAPSDVDATVADSHGTVYDINQAGEIVWLQEAPKLQVGTLSAIRTLSSSDGSATLTPRNVTQRLEVNYGTTAVPPVRIGPSTVHTGRFGRTIRDLVFDYNTNSLVSPDLSVLAVHMVKQGVARFAYCEEPDSVLWGLTTDGNLVGTTFDRDERVIGFHSHPLVNGVVETICAVPSSTLQRDVLFLQVRRTINGAVVRYVETLSRLYDGDLMTQSDAFFVDCGVMYDGSPVNQVTGVDHLEGQTVDVLADGAVYPSQVVVGGTITLPGTRRASKVAVGLHIDAFGETLDHVPQGPQGSTVGEPKRAVYVVVDEFETLGLKVGPPDYLMETVKYRSPATPMGQAPELHTGPVKVPIDSGWETAGHVRFEAPQPLPATIRALTVAVDVS